MTKRPFVFALAAAALMLASAAVLRYAANTGVVTDDVAKRGMQVIIGLWLAVQGNFMPKSIRGSRSLAAGRRVQAALRVGGYAFTFAGLFYAGAWALAPLQIADITSIVVVASAMLLTMSYAGWAVLTCRPKAAAPS
jgi:hypothetical protein